MQKDFKQYLPLTGGTLNGDLLIKSSTQDSTTTTAGNQWGKRLFLRDKNNVSLGQVETFVDPYGKTIYRLSAHRIINDTDVWNQIDLNIKNDGTPSYRVSAPEAFRTAISAVSKTGDDLSGNYNLKGNITIGGDNLNYRGITIYGNDSAPTIGIRNTGSRMVFDQFPKNNEYGERFLLPTPNSNRTKDEWINILTSKNPVTNSSTYNWLTYTNSDKFTGTIYYKSVGMFLMVTAFQIKLSNDLVANGSIDLGTLPSGYRPSKTLVLTGVLGSQRETFMAWISSGGVITLFAPKTEAISKNSNLYFSGFGFID